MCAGNGIRGQVTTVMSASGDASKTLTIDCASTSTSTSTSTSYTDDLGAFEIGFATLTPLYPPWLLTGESIGGGSGGWVADGSGSGDDWANWTMIGLIGIGAIDEEP